MIRRGRRVKFSCSPPACPIRPFSCFSRSCPLRGRCFFRFCPPMGASVQAPPHAHLQPHPGDSTRRCCHRRYHCLRRHVSVRSHRHAGHEVQLRAVGHIATHVDPTHAANEHEMDTRTANRDQSARSESSSLQQPTAPGTHISPRSESKAKAIAAFGLLDVTHRQLSC